MRLKPVPEVPSDALSVVETARLAVPLVPGSEDDCCARLLARMDAVTSRDEARTWLTFLRALGLAEETASGGFVRTDAEVVDADEGAARDALAATFRERVFGAREVLAILDDADGGSVSTGAVFEAFEPTVPRWERDKDPGRWREVWTERVERLLGWAVVFGLARRVDGGYAAVGR